MGQTVVLIDNGSAEIVTLNAGTSAADIWPTIKLSDFKESRAQVWGYGGRKKGIQMCYDLSELPLKTLLTACFEPVWLRLHLVDIVTSMVEEHTDPERVEDDGWTKEGMLDIASQFEGFAKRLRKAAK